MLLLVVVSHENIPDRIGDIHDRNSNSMRQVSEVEVVHEREVEQVIEPEDGKLLAVFQRLSPVLMLISRPQGWTREIGRGKS